MTDAQDHTTRSEGASEHITRPDLPVPAPRLVAQGALPRVGRAALRVARATGRTLPPGLLAELATELSRDLGVQVAITLDAVRTQDALPVWPAAGCFACVELSPALPPVVVDIDLRVALASASLLSGASVSATALLRSPSTVERAALSYLCLRALDRCVEARSAARLLGLYDAPPDVLRLVPAVCFDLRVQVGESVGRVIVQLPTATLDSPWLSAARPASFPGALTGAQCQLAIELAHASLRSTDLALLSVGDVVVCNRPTVGAALLRLVGGRRGFSLSLEPQATSTLLRLGALVPAPEATHMTTPSTGADLLADATLPATVELGRLLLAAEELAALTPGDTLLLGRPLASPLDLVVGGKVIARGELVEVEGELGFRVTTLR